MTEQEYLAKAICNLCDLAVFNGFDPNSALEYVSDFLKGTLEFCDYSGWLKKKKTNADCIRSMTDEELANWWAFMQVAYDFNDPQKTLEWLKEEVTHNGEV